VGPCQHSLGLEWLITGQSPQQPSHFWHRNRQQLLAERQPLIVPLEKRLVYAAPFSADVVTACSRVTVRNA
jgi:hypothetical protein